MTRSMEKMALVAICLAASALAAAETFESLVPVAGAQWVQPFGVRNGEVVGNFNDPVSGASRGFSFSRADGYTVFAPAGSSFVAPIRSDGVGRIYGSYADAATGHVHGFVREKNGRFKVFDAPGRNVDSTTVEDVNSLGFAIGDWRLVGDAFGFAHGFVRTAPGVVIEFDVPGSVMTRPMSINDVGYMAGTYMADLFVSPPRAFIRSPLGAFTTFDAPPGCSFLDDTLRLYINIRNDIAGGCTTDDFHSAGFIRNHDGTITMLSVPGASDTGVQGFTQDGTVVGFYYPVDSSTSRGFIRSPAGVYQTFDYPGAAQPGSTQVSRADANGDLSGMFIDESGQTGFVRFHD